MNAIRRKLSEAWKGLTIKERVRLFLALLIIIASFLPWLSFTIATFDSLPGESIPVVIRGIGSFGILSFLGALGFLLWRLLPRFGVTLPDFGFAPRTMERSCLIFMLAGPIIWMLESGFHFAIAGIGLWGTLGAGIIFAGLTFVRK